MLQCLSIQKANIFLTNKSVWPFKKLKIYKRVQIKFNFISVKKN